MGRIQSREYMKKLDEENVEKRVAFEVSVSKMELGEGRKWRKTARICQIK